MITAHFVDMYWLKYDLNFTFVNYTFETIFKYCFWMYIFSRLLLLIFYPISTYLSSIASFITWFQPYESFTYCRLTTMICGLVGNNVMLFGVFDGTFQLNMYISSNCFFVYSFCLLLIIWGNRLVSKSEAFCPSKMSTRFILWKSQKFWL